MARHFCLCGLIKLLLCDIIIKDLLHKFIGMEVSKVLKIKGAPTKREAELAISNDRLLVLWLEIWPGCPHNCGFCFNRGGRAKRTPDWLGLEEYFRAIDEFAFLGGKVLGIPGYGETFYQENTVLTLAIMEYAKKKGIRSYVFTAGDLLTENLAKKLFALDVSLMIKANSFKPDVQDELIGTKGYTAKRNEVMELLFRIGFNKPEMNEEGELVTRLGFVTSILPSNQDEIQAIWNYCEENNISADIDTVLPLGRGEETVEKEKIEEITLLLTGEEIHSPTYISKEHCDRTRYGLYLNFLGEVSPCLGCKDEINRDSKIARKGIATLGNIRDKDLASIWNSTLARKIRKREYSGKCTECEHFKKGECNSCFGRCCLHCSEERIEMTGCSFFK